MKRQALHLAAICFLAFTLNSFATVHYVDLNCTNPVLPYIGWSTAATNIQDAVDAANPGDTVLVTNGIYQTGGRVVYGSLTNRVVINKALLIQSVNGPLATTISGYRVPGTTNGNSAVRCVYLTNGACLSGFTLTNGATRNAGDAQLEQSGGGAWCEPGSGPVTNCIVTGNAANYRGGGAYSDSYGGSMFIGGTFTGNTAGYGAGAYGSALTNCIVTNNIAWQDGGGTMGCDARGCTYAGNTALYSGGGDYGSTLVNCTLTGNTAPFGGGESASVVFTSTLAGNSAIDPDSSPGTGGGAYSGTLYHCTLTGNSAGLGGGANAANLNYCTITGNSARYGGGVYMGTHWYCTLAGNTASVGGGGSLSAILEYCAVSTNSAPNGGGAYNGTLNWCVLKGNTVSYYGGGAYYATLNNCLLTANTASSYGGGTYGSSLNGCTLVANSASSSGGGTYRSTNNNCIIYFNTAGSNSNYYSGVLNYCCTVPLPGGSGNLTNAPLFINQPAGNYRLNSNSLCINVGSYGYLNSFDLDGRPRVVGGTVDLGAYEFQGPGIGEFIGWLQQFGLPTDGTADYPDTDGDGMNNWQEWRTGTNPTNALSVLKMASAMATNNPRGIIVSWQSVSGQTYLLQRGASLTAQPAFSTIQSNIVGQTGTTSYTDTAATNGGPFFYRVGVQ